MEPFYSHAHRIYVKSLFKRSVLEAKAVLFKRKIEFTLASAYIRSEFEDAKNLTDPRTIGAWIRETERKLVANYSDNPLIHGRMPGGVLYERNMPPPQWTASEWAAAEGYIAGQTISPWQAHQMRLVRLEKEKINDEWLETGMMETAVKAEEEKMERDKRKKEAEADLWNRGGGR